MYCKPNMEVRDIFLKEFIHKNRQELIIVLSFSKLLQTFHKIEKYTANNF